MSLKHQIISLIPLSIIVAGFLSYNLMSAQWSGPSAIAPSNNTAAPVNVSSNYQAKLGDLGAIRIRAGEYCDAAGADCITNTTGPLWDIWTIDGSLTVQGTTTATSFMYSSDERLKHDIKTIDNPLAIIEQLRGVTFAWNKDNSQTYGLIAQEVELVMPELVGTDASGFKSVAYGNLIPLLIEALKAQQAEIDELKSKSQ
jgi:Chaperone of endosialidase